jgi:hypothetical protein
MFLLVIFGDFFPTTFLHQKYVTWKSFKMFATMIETPLKRGCLITDKSSWNSIVYCILDGQEKKVPNIVQLEILPAVVLQCSAVQCSAVQCSAVHLKEAPMTPATG